MRSWTLPGVPGRALPRTAAAAVAVAAMFGGSAGTVPARAAAGTAFVRVNQLGYAAGSQAKRAYLMAKGSQIINMLS